MRTSAGLLVFRRTAGLEVLLGHMGGPFWARKDAGAWTIPKGEPAAGEAPFDTAGSFQVLLDPEENEWCVVKPDQAHLT